MTRLSRINPEWAISLVLAVVTAAVFWPVAGFDFVNYDDTIYVTTNPKVQEGLTFSGVLWAGQSLIQLLPVLAILGGITAAVMSLAIWRFNRGKIFE